MKEYDYCNGLLKSGDLNVKRSSYKVIIGLDNLIDCYKQAKSNSLNNYRYEILSYYYRNKLNGYIDALADAGVLSKRGMRIIYNSLGWRESIYED